MNSTQLRDDIWRIRNSPRNGNIRHSWEQVRRELVPADKLDIISRPLVWKIAHVVSYEPKDEAIRDALGLDPEAQVVYVDGMARPKAQAVGALECKCGRWYVSNHPRRKRCFECGPYRGKRQ